MTTEEKIKKLLALAGSPNEHEAKLALDKARELMAKYCIEIMDNSKEQRNIIFTYYYPPIRVTSYNFKYCAIITDILSAHFGTFVLIEQKSKIQCHGFEKSLLLAKYGFDCIFNQLNSAFKLGYVEERSLSYSEAFWYGAAQGIRIKFTLRKENRSEAMTVYDPVYAKLQKMDASAYWFEHNPESETGIQQGRKAGTEASFYKGLNQTATRGILLK